LYAELCTRGGCAIAKFLCAIHDNVRAKELRKCLGPFLHFSSLKYSFKIFYIYCSLISGKKLFDLEPGGH